MATKITKSEDVPIDAILEEVPVVDAILEEVPVVDAILAVLLRDSNSYEYNLSLPRSVVEDMLDPQTPARFIEVPCSNMSGRLIEGSTRFLNTVYVKSIDVRGYK